ncbi:MAG: flagellar biosynthetic protein FliR [Leptospiraceae bacterium]|nr:flagellar biosynthetic protein FliR [Leptospiraceae bacterium]
MEGFSDNVQYYGLIVSRLLGLLYVAPILSTQTVTTRLRVTLALLLAFILFPATANYLPELPSSTVGYGLAILGQLFIGGIIGFMVLIIFTSFQVIGEILSLQMGISFSEVLDPQSNVSIPLLGTLKNTIGILLFLAVPFQMDGLYLPAYLHMIRAVGFSFQAVPQFLPTDQIAVGVIAYLDHAFKIMFITAIKVGVPMVGILFISSLTLGLLGRAAPQMNLISMGIPINIIVGLIVLATLIPVIVPLMGDVFHQLYSFMGEMFEVWPGSGS